MDMRHALLFHKLLSQLNKLIIFDLIFEDFHTSGEGGDPKNS